MKRMKFSGRVGGLVWMMGAALMGVVGTLGAAAQTLRTLASFDGANGAHSYAGLIADANGNLLGTTHVGGAYEDGVVFKNRQDGRSLCQHAHRFGHLRWD
jgi:hypothetical protein